MTYNTRPKPKTKRCGKCGKVTPLSKLYCQMNADGLWLVTEPPVCEACLAAMEAAQWGGN